MRRADDIPVSVAECAIVDDDVEGLDAGRVVDCVGEGFHDGASVGSEGGPDFSAGNDG